MKSGLEDRNNPAEHSAQESSPKKRLNEVRPGRPEQYVVVDVGDLFEIVVSMKSGLEDWNN